MWCKNNCEENPAKFRKKMASFLDYVRFQYIPCDVLVKEVDTLPIYIIISIIYNIYNIYRCTRSRLCHTTP